LKQHICGNLNQSSKAFPISAPPLCHPLPHCPESRHTEVW
jgi:hypothetical protein